MECLESLVTQTLPINIYLSISFENPELQEEFAKPYSENRKLHLDIMNIIIKPQKTAQMKHIIELVPHICYKHEWIMFCDDDDTYAPTRVHTMLQSVVYGLNVVKDSGNNFVGIYESTFGKDHRIQRHEYWCYCIHLSLLVVFANKIQHYPDILDNKCCDVLFGEYLRRAHSTLIYGQLKEQLYNYRIDNNSDSITGEIKTNKVFVRKARTITPDNKLECAKELNDYLDKHMDVYMHDIYLRTIVDIKFDTILKNEFLSEYEILYLVDNKFMEKMKALYEDLRGVCGILYDIPLT
jgi:hypothetical protein